MAGELESCKPLSGLLSGLAQEAFHGHSGITEELLQSQLYPEVPLEEFRPFLAKMRGILKVAVEYWLANTLIKDARSNIFFFKVLFLLNVLVRKATLATTQHQEFLAQKKSKYLV